MGAEGAVSGAAGSAAVSSAGAAGAADAAGSSFTLWLGADGCAADAAVLSASEDAESFFGVSVLFFFVSFLVLWAASVSPSHSRADGSTRRLGRQQGCGAKTAHRDGKRHHRRGHHLARRTARLLFWCSCIFLSHSACSASKLYSNAASRRQKCFKCHLYVYSIHPTPSSRQCPSVSRAGRFVEVFHHSRHSMWKTNRAAVLLHPKEKKFSSERDFCVFLLLS